MRPAQMKHALLLGGFVLAALLVAAMLTTRNDADLGYQPKANPFQNLSAAQAAAQDKNKKILIVAGGAWCRWCRALNQFLSDNKDLKAELYKEFEIVKVYVGEDNDNKAFFSTLPKAAGYPHFWVLSSNGRVIDSINTSKLENGQGSYNKEAFLSFIRSYAAP